MVIGLIGILVAMVLFLVLVYKNCVSFWVALACAMLVAVTNQLDILDALFTVGGEKSSFLQGMVDLLPTMFKVVFMGAIIGKLYTESGAVVSIANALVNTFVAKRSDSGKVVAAVVVLAVLNAILTLGGIDGYVLTFTMIPVCLHLSKMCGIPRRFIPGMMTLNTAFMIFPGSPQIYNVMAVAAAASTGHTEVTLTSGLIPGIIASAIVVVLGCVTLIVCINRAMANGETFDDGGVQMPEARDGKVPPVIFCVLPLVVVFGIAVAGFDVFYALLAGLVLASILFFPYLPKVDTRGNRISLISSLRNAFNDGANQYPHALLSVITPAGLAAVVTSTAVFGAIIGMLSGTGFHPIVLAVIMVCIIVALTSSPPATLMIVIPLVIGISQSMGSVVSAGAIARISVIAASTFETLPFNGLIVLCLGLTHCTHKESYKIMFLNTVVYTSLATIVAALLLYLFPALG